MGLEHDADPGGAEPCEVRFQIVGLTERSFLHLVGECAEDLVENVLDDGAEEPFFATEVVVERLAGDPCLGEDRVDAGACIAVAQEDPRRARSP